jgi:GAF domain-containing protein
MKPHPCSPKEITMTMPNTSASNELFPIEIFKKQPPRRQPSNVRTCQPANVPPPTVNYLLPALYCLIVPEHIGSWIGAPLVSRERLLGFLSLDKVERNFYNAEHVANLAILAGQALYRSKNGGRNRVSVHHR